MKTKLQFIFLCCFISASTAFAQQDARQFDVMGQLNCESAKAHLDNLAIHLQQDPTLKAYIIFYGGKSFFNTIYNKRTKRYSNVQMLPRRGEAKARINPWKPYIINNRGIEDSRIEVIDGGYREEPTVEFWLVPPGAKPPTPMPTLKEADIKFRKGGFDRKRYFSDC